MAEEKFYVKALPVTLLLLAVSRVAYSITCLSCDAGGVDKLSSCKDILECSDGHTCYIEKVLSMQTFTPKFKAGCRDIHDCNLMTCSKDVLGSVFPAHQTARPGIGKRQNEDPVICTECCFNDTCNTKGCGATFTVPTSTGVDLLQCFQCTHQREGNPPCSDIVSCQSGESCYYEYNVHVDGPPFFELGCKSTAFCNFLNAHVNEKDRTTSCCDEHLCNQNPYKKDNTSETIFEALKCPTDLVQTTTTTTPKPTTTATTTTTTPIPTSTTPITTTATTTPTTTPPPTTTTPTATTTTPTPTTTTTPQPTTTTPIPTTTTTPQPTTTTPTPMTTTTPIPTTTTTPIPTTTTTPVPTTTTPVPTTTTPIPTTTTQTTTPLPTTTPKPTTTAPIRTSTISPGANTTVAQSRDPISCEVCSGPPRLCDRLHHSTTCVYPNNFCVNHLVNLDSGARDLERKCGDIDTCVHEWFQGTSDNDRCTTLDEHFVQTLAFECTFCCTTDNCNVPIVPEKDSLFKN